jgi:hypothetical protein
MFPSVSNMEANARGHDELTQDTLEKPISEAAGRTATSPCSARIAKGDGYGFFAGVGAGGLGVVRGFGAGCVAFFAAMLLSDGAFV